MQNPKANMIFAAIVVFLLAAGGWLIYKEMNRLPDVLIKQATTLNYGLVSSRKIINKTTSEIKNLERSEDWELLAPYAERENWSSQIQESNTLIDSASEKYSSAVIPILDTNHNRDEEKLKNRN